MGVGGRGEVLAVRGPGGLTSSRLAAGTLLGTGAAIEAGQDLQTPKGTLAEIQWDRARLRVNEDSSVRMPGTESEPLRLERGAMVVLAPDDVKVTIAAGPGQLEVQGGEAEVRIDGEQPHFAVIRGVAELVVDGRARSLHPGESVDLSDPPEDPKSLEVVSSLASLRDTEWAQTFAATAAPTLDAEVPKGLGSLTARRAGSSYESQPLRLVEQRVTVKISGGIAYTEIEQAFYNERAEELEGIYRFPIPSDASLSDLSLLVGRAWVQGAVVEKNRGRRIFDAIVDATVPRDPALLEWQRGNSFKLRVFPIPGKAERRVRLAYTQVLPAVGEMLRYRFPLEGGHASGTTMDRFHFTVQIDGRELSEEQIAAIRTSMLDPQRRRESGSLVLEMQREHFVPTFDLGVEVPMVPKTAAPPSVHTDRDGQSYFMVSLLPEFQAASPPATHYAFVVDRSYSTAPSLWPMVQATLASMTDMLGKDDRFTVLACDSACDAVEGGLMAPSDAAAQRVQSFLGAQERWGASDLGGMLESGRHALSSSDEARKVVVYLGDGVATSGELAPDRLRQALQSWNDTSVMAVALGGRSDLTMLRAVTRATGGDLVEIDARDDATALVRELHLRARVPALREPTFALPDGLSAVHPLHADAIRSGETITLVGKVNGPIDDAITLRGHAPSGPFEQRFPITLTPHPSQSDTVARHLPRTWAQAELDELTQTRGHAAQSEIVALSTRYNVLSRYTALLVLENDAMFQEFGVARHAADKDAWDGAIPEQKGETLEPLDTLDDLDTAGPEAESARSRGVGGMAAPSSSEAAPAPSAAPSRSLPKEAAAKKKSLSFDDGDGVHYRRPAPPRPQLRIAATHGSISARMQRRIDDLKGAVARAPSSRSAHRRLVGTATSIGHPQAIEFARAWATVDPEYAPALDALADAMAAAGDPLAMRVYESVVELLPFSEQAHQRLATAYRTQGDTVRECSHRHALASIKPDRSTYARDGAACLGGSPAPDIALASGAQLRATLEWADAQENLDIALLDARGRRLSALRPEGIQVRQGRGQEELALRRVAGVVRVVVTRLRDEGSASTLPATLTLRTPSGRRTFKLDLGEGTTAVARVSWTTPRPVYYR